MMTTIGKERLHGWLLAGAALLALTVSGCRDPLLGLDPIKDAIDDEVTYRTQRVTLLP
jgi:hypothetical protein